MDDISLLEFVICQCSNSTWNCEQLFIKDLVENVIHDKKHFDDIVLLEFLICQCSSNTWECEQCLMKDFVQNVIHDNKGLTAFFY